MKKKEEEKKMKTNYTKEALNQHTMQSNAQQQVRCNQLSGYEAVAIGMGHKKKTKKKKWSRHLLLLQLNESTTFRLKQAMADATCVLFTVN